MSGDIGQGKGVCGIPGGVLQVEFCLFSRTFSGQLSIGEDMDELVLHCRRLNDIAIQSIRVFASEVENRYRSCRRGAAQKVRGICWDVASTELFVLYEPQAVKSK